MNLTASFATRVSMEASNDRSTSGFLRQMKSTPPKNAAMRAMIMPQMKNTGVSFPATCMMVKPMSISTMNPLRRNACIITEALVDLPTGIPRLLASSITSA